MTCRQAEQAMMLQLGGEPTASLLEQHLQECAGCAHQAEKFRQLGELLRQRAAWPEEEEKQMAARTAVLARRRRRAWPSGAWQTAAAAVALLLCGFGGGWAARMRLAPAVRTGDAGTAAQFRVEAIEAGAPEVAIRYAAVRQGQLQGPLDDADVQHLLLQAVEHPVNAGVRMDAIRLLGQAQAPAAAPGVEAALVAALRDDPNPGVRLRALAVLGPLAAAGRPRLLQTLAASALADSNAGVRAQAVQALGQSAAAADLLRQIGGQTGDASVRLSCAAALQRLGAAVPPAWLRRASLEEGNR